MKKKIVLAGCIMAMAMVFTGCGKKTESTTFIMSDVQEGDHPTAEACDEFAKRVYRETDGRVNNEVQRQTRWSRYAWMVLISQDYPDLFQTT